MAFYGMCGDAYLQSETYGGVVFLTVRGDYIPRKMIETASGRRLELSRYMEQLFALGAAHNGVNVDDALFELKDTIYRYNAANPLDPIDFDFRVLLPEVWLAQSQDIQNLMPNGLIDAEDTNLLLDAIVELVGDQYSQGVRPDEPGGEVYGFKLEQRFEPYANDQLALEGEDFFTLCGVQTEEGYQCHQDFMRETLRYDDASFGSLARQVDFLRQALEQPERYQWPLDENNNPDTSEHEAFIDAYEDCVGVGVSPGLIEQRKDLCHDAFLIGDPRQICDMCRFQGTDAAQCQPEHMFAEYEDLTDPVEWPPIPPERGQVLTFETHDRIVTDLSVNDYLCVLSGVQGELDAQDDYALVTFNPSNGIWRVDASGGDKNKRKRTTAHGYCVERQHFIDTTPSNPQWIWEEAFAAITSTPGDSGDIVFGDGASTAMLTSVGGDFNGGGEYAEVEMATSPTDDHKLTVKGLSGDGVSSHAAAFGLSHPAGGMAILASLNDEGALSKQLDSQGLSGGWLASGGQYNEAQLARIDEAMCFLTRTSGAFKSVRESIKLVPGPEYWTLQVKGKVPFLGDPRWVKGVVSCYRYDQSTF